ncbi:hypothetical protein PHJA_002854500 [Phtheirospermum japonicum]|uniref:Uncharacterized protein n=1 Tax=Phtheirospermum japonicum TaxID=374723 RepID=A0A830DH06_9LAMI|nr:hypothetical protein PHJA_002854500 [Phtheirospermum japonicum]
MVAALQQTPITFQSRSPPSAQSLSRPTDSFPHIIIASEHWYCYLHELVTYTRSSSDGAQLFYLGLTMGIAYSSLRYNLEIKKLTKSLKQSEDLVQDLHEELEMKDASTVKELAVEDYDPYFNDDAMQVVSPEQNLTKALQRQRVFEENRSRA